MKEKLYLDTLKKYQKWAKENKKQVEQDFTERRAMCEDMQAYSKERLAKLTEEEFYELIAPLWAMRIWGTKSIISTTLWRATEQEQDAVVRKFRTTAADGKNYQVLHYNLDLIIALGYRVQSHVLND